MTGHMTKDDRRRLWWWILAHVFVGAAVLALASYGVHALVRSATTERMKLGKRVNLFQRRITQGVEVALVGNSLMAYGVDLGMLKKRLGERGWSAAEVTQDGSGCPFWYLVTKNVVVAHPKAPKALVLFVVARELTESTERTGGRRGLALELVSRDWEPEYLGVMLKRYARERNLTDAVLLSLRSVWRAYYLKNTVSEIVFARLTSLPGSVLRWCSPDVKWPSYRKSKRKELPEKALLLTRRRAAGTAPPEVRESGFRERVDGSFLPLIERMCAERGIRLCVARQKPNPEVGAEERRRDGTLVRYMDELREYCSQRGILFFDYSEDTHLHAGHFAWGHHLNDEGRRYQTGLLADDLLKSLPASGESLVR